MESKPDDYRDQIEDWFERVCDIAEEEQ